MSTVIQLSELTADMFSYQVRARVNGNLSVAEFKDHGAAAAYQYDQDRLILIEALTGFYSFAHRFINGSTHTEYLRTVNGVLRTLLKHIEAYGRKHTPQQGGEFVFTVQANLLDLKTDPGHSFYLSYTRLEIFLTAFRNRWAPINATS